MAVLNERRERIFMRITEGKHAFASPQKKCLPFSLRIGAWDLRPAKKLLQQVHDEGPHITIERRADRSVA
jgi:hypothetical protein